MEPSLPLGNFRSQAENYKVGGSGCWKENGTENSDWGGLGEAWQLREELSIYPDFSEVIVTHLYLMKEQCPLQKAS